MPRISKQLLVNAAERACRAIGLDYGSHYENGKAVVGRVRLAKGLSGWDLEQVCSEGGDIRQLNGYCNAMTASEMLAFLRGVELACDLAAESARRKSGRWAPL